MKTPVSESLFKKVARPATFLKRDSNTQVFSCEYCTIFKNSFFYRTLLVAASKFLTELAENNCEKNHFSVVFLRNFLQIFLSLSCNVSKNNSFTGSLQFLSFFKLVRDVSRTQPNIKIEPFAKIVNISKDMFRMESNI